jgi:hypothetical protein
LYFPARHLREHGAVPHQEFVQKAGRELEVGGGGDAAAGGVLTRFGKTGYLWDKKYQSWFWKFPKNYFMTPVIASGI